MNTAMSVRMQFFMVYDYFCFNNSY